MIHSTPFGGVTLTGEDAVAFLDAIENPAEPTAKLREMIANGLRMAEELRETGRVRLRLHRAHKN